LKSLEEYAVKSMHLGRITGVSLGVHAIPDAFLLMHTGVGCKYKAASQIATHDWQVHPNRREGWTEVGDRALIKGSAGRIGPYARTWGQRRQPAFMAMVTASFLQMTGEDFAGAVKKAAEGLDFPLVLIPAGGFEGDLYEGYARLLLEVVRQARFEPGADRKGEVGILGYFFDRYEADHTGNLQQIRFLLSGIGLKLGPVLLSGRPFAELLRVGRCGMLLQTPYTRPVEPELRRICPPSKLEPVDLPVGLKGTARWVRQVAGAAGIDRDRVEEFVQAQVSHARSQLAKLADRMRGLKAAVFADTPLAAGLCSLLVDLGLEPVLVGLRDRSLGGRGAFLQALQRDGVPLPDGVEILEDPALKTVQERLVEWIVERGLQCVFGSSVELNLFSAWTPDEIMRLVDRPDGAAGGPGLFAVEIGFPSTGHHVTHADPFMGFGGTVALAQRILQAGQRHALGLWLC
jgi:nitrogenase molybdenum-iron protein alpha/beta subunit